MRVITLKYPEALKKSSAKWTLSLALNTETMFWNIKKTYLQKYKCYTLYEAHMFPVDKINIQACFYWYT